MREKRKDIKVTSLVFNKFTGAFLFVAIALGGLYAIGTMNTQTTTGGKDVTIVIPQGVTIPEALLQELMKLGAKVIGLDVPAVPMPPPPPPGGKGCFNPPDARLGRDQLLRILTGELGVKNGLLASGGEIVEAIKLVGKSDNRTTLIRIANGKAYFAQSVRDEGWLMAVLEYAKFEQAIESRASSSAANSIMFLLKDTPAALNLSVQSVSDFSLVASFLNWSGDCP